MKSPPGGAEAVGLGVQRLKAEVQGGPPSSTSPDTSAITSLWQLFMQGLTPLCLALYGEFNPEEGNF